MKWRQRQVHSRPVTQTKPSTTEKTFLTFILLTMRQDTKSVKLTRRVWNRKIGANKEEIGDSIKGEKDERQKWKK